MLFARAELARSKLLFGGLTLMAGGMIFVLLFQQALLSAVLDGMAGAVKRQNGAIIVFGKDAKRTFGAGHVDAEQTAAVKKVPGVAGSGGLGVSLLSYKVPRREERVNVSVIGYQPGLPGTPTAVRSGRLPGATDEIVASAEGAVGRFGIGDTLKFEPGSVSLKVVGLTENALLSVGPAVWIPWASYEKLVKAAFPIIKDVVPSALAVQPDPGVNVDGLVRAINAQVPTLDALPKDQAAESAPGRRPIQTAFLFVMGLCYLVVSVVIGFFFLTMTLRKEQSIIMLRAVGATGAYLVASLLLEVAVVTIGGLVTGIAMLYAVKPMVRANVIITIDPRGIAATVAPALIVAILGALPPIRRVLNANPMHAVTRPNLSAAG